MTAGGGEAAPGMTAPDGSVAIVPPGGGEGLRPGTGTSGARATVACGGGAAGAWAAGLLESPVTSSSHAQPPSASTAPNVAKPRISFRSDLMTCLCRCP